MPKFYPSVSAAQDTGNKPVMVKIANDPRAPESIRGKTVTGRCNWHGYQGIVDNETGQEVWRGKMHEAPNLYGTVTVGGVTYNGETVSPSGKSDAAARANALADAKAQAAKMAAAAPAPAKKAGIVEACPHCGGGCIDGSCPTCSSEPALIGPPDMAQARAVGGVPSAPAVAVAQNRWTVIV